MKLVLLYVIIFLTKASYFVDHIIGYLQLFGFHNGSFKKILIEKKSSYIKILIKTKLILYKIKLANFLIHIH